MQSKKKSLTALLNLIEPKRRQVCLEILKEFKEEIGTFPGSRTKHQDWPGGYLDHVLETMNLAVVWYEALAKKRKFPFKLNDALFVLFLHDIDKLFRYTKGANEKYKNELAFISQLCGKYDYTLKEVEKNAIKYTHGENEDWHPTKRIMTPLACFVHICDVSSARIWYNFGRDRQYW